MNGLQKIMNAARRMTTMFPGYFEEAKHNHYKDFGYPDSLTFTQFHAIYERNGFGAAGVEKTILKTWEDNPSIWEEEKPKESDLESEIRQRFADLRLWQKMADADRRYLVGGYSGLILRIADNKAFKEPVETVSGGLSGLVEVIPVWAGQLTVSEWDNEERSETYGQPKMFSFTESSVGNDQNKNRSFELHPDRVLVWSHDGTVHGKSLLKAGYNSLQDLEKISGAGGEGFYKNAKAPLRLEVDKDAKIADIASSMGVTVEDVADKIDEQVDDFNKGFDASLLLQGISAQNLSISLPSPEHFFNVALQLFAASIGCPQKILVGNQNGERASTEDSAEWAKVNMARRNNIVIPNITALLNRLESFGILPERDWFLDWTDLTESSAGEKMDRAVKMAEINAKQQNEPVYLVEEIREAAGHKPVVAIEYGDD